MSGDKPINKTDERIAKLIALTIERTESKSIQWQHTSDENSFRLVLPSVHMKITMFDQFDPELGADFVVRSLDFVNDKGRVIEEYSPSTYDKKSEFDILYKLARRSAYNTDGLLDALFKEISEEDDVPF